MSGGHGGETGVIRLAALLFCAGASPLIAGRREVTAPYACLGHHVPFTYSFIARSKLQANLLQKKPAIIKNCGSASLMWPFSVGWLCSETRYPS